MSSAQRDVEALLVRMRERRYPETIPVLASYWLKTVYAGGHALSWWKDLDHLLKDALRDEPLSEPSREAIIGIRSWIQKRILVVGKPPQVFGAPLEPYRPNLRPEWLAPYIRRLLTEWVATEVSRLLVDGSEPEVASDGGIPALAIGRALERLLVRERLSPETLEMFLHPDALSPKYVYPADAEMLRDVVLALLNRTEAPPLPVMPATILGAASGSPMSTDFSQMVQHACYLDRQGGEKVHVPISGLRALEILQRTPMRTASMIVTMDGRWWESERLQTGDQHFIVYKPGGLLRIDHSADHAKLIAPWPETQLQWRGPVQFSHLELFGREWHVSSWESDGDRTWLNLVFTRALPIAEIQAAPDVSFRRARPAAVDIAWTALENALAESVAHKSAEPVENLSRTDFIPLGRAILGLAEATRNRWLTRREPLETQLNAIRYLQSQVASDYGRVPWRVLPRGIRDTLLRKHSDAALIDLMNQVFEAFPETPSKAA
jgi:hypothetical protein